MPYILLTLGVLLGLYGLYRFFLSATLRQIRALALATAFVVTGGAMFFLAITGRLPAAIAILAALWPVALALWHKRRKSAAEPDKDDNVSAAPRHNAGPMTIQEALDILGLPENAGEAEIRATYKRLIKKVHPDQEGSTWMAEKLNEARDTLLKSRQDPF